MTRFDLTIPIPQKISLNAIYAGTHWSKRSDLKNLYHWAVKSQIPKGIQFKGNVKCRYIFRWHKHALDCSNCAYQVKLLEDVLVKERIIPDDTPKYVVEITTQSILDKELPCDAVQILIEEALSPLV